MFTTPFAFMAAPAGGGGYDPDAQAFFTAAGITDVTQKNAVNGLVVDLKSNSLWGSMKILYPLVGTTSSQQSYNLIDPSSFQIDWMGSWTYSVEGAQGNGSDTIANIAANLSTIGISSVNDWAIGTYNRISGLTNSVDMGVGPDEFSRIVLYSALSNSFLIDFGSSNERASSSTPGTDGFWVGTRISSSTYGLYRNGSSLYNVTTGSQSATGLNSGYWVFGDVNFNGTNVSPVLPSANEYALWFISNGLTSSQISTLNTIVQDYETALSRNV